MAAAAAAVGGSIRSPSKESSSSKSVLKQDSPWIMEFPSPKQRQRSKEREHRIDFLQSSMTQRRASPKRHEAELPSWKEKTGRLPSKESVEQIRHGNEEAPSIPIDEVILARRSGYEDMSRTPSKEINTRTPSKEISTRTPSKEVSESVLQSMSRPSSQPMSRQGSKERRQPSKESSIPKSILKQSILSPYEDMSRTPSKEISTRTPSKESSTPTPSKESSTRTPSKEVSESVLQAMSRPPSQLMGRPSSQPMTQAMDRSSPTSTKAPGNPYQSQQSSSSSDMKSISLDMPKSSEVDLYQGYDPFDRQQSGHGDLHHYAKGTTPACPVGDTPLGDDDADIHWRLPRRDTGTLMPEVKVRFFVEPLCGENIDGEKQRLED